MGSGESTYIKNQETFVKKNREIFSNSLNTGGKYKYTQTQIECKLRQLYSNTDMNKKNEWSYISPKDWIKVKKELLQ